MPTRDDWESQINALRVRFVQTSGIVCVYYASNLEGTYWGGYFVGKDCMSGPGGYWYEAPETGLGLEVQAQHDPDRYQRLGDIGAQVLPWNPTHPFSRIQAWIDVIDAGQWTDSEGVLHVIQPDPTVIKPLPEISSQCLERDFHIFDMMIRLP